MATPLDAERARLRGLGHTEDEISRIFIARETVPPPQQQAPMGGAGQQPMSGTLNNVSAVVAHARGAFAGTRNEIASVRNSAAPATERAFSFASLAVKAAIVLLLGYGVSLEISILQSQARNAGLDATIKSTPAGILELDKGTSAREQQAIFEYEHGGRERRAALLAKKSAGGLTSGEDSELGRLTLQALEVIGAERSHPPR